MSYVSDTVAASGAELAGYTIGVTAERRRLELGAALERHGARVVYGPAMHVLPLADDTELHEATRRCMAAPLDFAVTTTAVGFRGWLDAATGWGLGSGLTDALAGSRILTRGPKVRGAVRAAGLREHWSPESESSPEVLDWLLHHAELAGARIAIQLHGDPLRELIDALRGAGAEVIEVPVYRWAAPVDRAPLHALLDATIAGSMDALTFTSAPASASVLQVADDLGRGTQLLDVLRDRVLCAAVGPVTAAPLLAAGVPVTMPERFRLGALVRDLTTALPAHHVPRGAPSALDASPPH